MDLGLTGKVAIVSGGSRGIGKGAAAALAREGCDVAIVGRDLAVARAASEEIAQASGRRLEPYSADTGSSAEVDRAVAAIAADFGRIDILVNSAARPNRGHQIRLADTGDEFFHQEMNVKVMGYIRMARAAAPHMISRRWGRIINISGLAARQTGTIVGSVRNVAVAAMSKNLADELGPHGINVNCIHPGLTRTEATPAILAAQAQARGETVEEVEKRLSANNLIGQILSVEALGDVVAFLASPLSVAITGESIGTGGGAPGAIHY